MLHSYPTHSHLGDGWWGKHRTVGSVMKRKVNEWRKLWFLQSANPYPNSQHPLQFTKYSEGLDITWAISLILYQAKICFVKSSNFSGGFSLKEVFKPNILRAIVNKAFPGATCTFTSSFFFLTFLQWQIPWGIFYDNHKLKYLNLIWCQFLHYCFSDQSEELWGLWVLSEFFKKFSIMKVWIT